MTDKSILYTITSTDPKHYNVIKTNLQPPFGDHCRLTVTNLTTKATFVVLNENDYITINNVRYYFKDKYSEMNNNLINVIKAKERPANYAAMLEEIHQLKEENKKLLNVINHIELNKVFGFESEKNRNMFSCMSNPQDNKYSLNFS